MMRLAQRLAAAAAAILLPTAVLAEDLLPQQFAAPPKSAYPRARWWWPGGAVSDGELVREVDLLDRAGFGGAEIQAFNPGVSNLSPAERATINDYANPAFFAHVRAAAAAARQRGMKLDYTFGSAWPSGGGFAITPEKALLELTMSRTEVTGGGGEPVRLNLPQRTKRLGAFSGFDPRSRDPRIADWPARMARRGHVVAVVAVQGDAPELKAADGKPGLQLFPWQDVVASGRLNMTTAVVLTDKLRADGVLDWAPPPGRWQIFVFQQFASNTSAMGAAGEGPQLVLDHMNPQAFAAHAARVGDGLVQALGNDMAGIDATFVDSLELFQDLPWTEDFLDQFRARRGYELTPYLPLILQPGWMQAWGEHWSAPYFQADGGVADRVRHDYRLTVSQLMLERFLQPYVDWNHRNGLRAKFQAHGGAIDILKGYGMADVPETEDLVHGGDPYFMRFARSAGDLYGRNVISAESFAWPNRPYSVTPAELRRRADLLFSGGVNAIVEHGVDYRLHAETWPGWHAFAPSAFSGGFSTMLTESNPIWPALPQLNRYIARTSAVLRQGRTVVPIAYYYGEIGYYVGIEDQGAGAQSMEKALLAGGYDFDRINPDSIAKARVEGGALVSPGGARYAALLLPRIDGMPAETAEQIAAFARSGLKVIFTDAAPSRDVTLADASTRDARVRAAVAEILASGGVVKPADQVVAAVRESGAPANLRYVDGDPTGLVFVQRNVGPRTVTFLNNTASDARSVTLALPGGGGVERWDAMDGTRVRLGSRRAPGATEVALQLAAGESALLVQDQAIAVGPQPAKVIRELTLPLQGWRLSVSGHETKGAPVEADLGEAKLADWRQVPRLERFSGVGVYRRSFTLPPSWSSRGQRVTLDLGQVHDMATVTLNGRVLPPAISAPFRLDVTRLLRPGANDISIAVANVPHNALAASIKAAGASTALVPAGLVGPVRLLSAR